MLFEQDKERIRLALEKNKRVEGECWIWTGQTRDSSYGKRGYIQIGSGKTKRRYMTHRASYRLYVGEVPAGLEVCHTCDRTLCFRPKHLFTGTHKDNMHDAAVKGRIRNGNRPVKLNWLDAIDIRARRAAGESGVLIAKEYGVHYSQVYRIGTGKAWRD